MSDGHLTERQIEILRYLRDKVPNENGKLFDQVLTSTLPKSDIDTVCGMINDEYLMKGLKDKDYNPNEYGRELEELLDMVNKPRVTMEKR